MKVLCESCGKEINEDPRLVLKSKDGNETNWHEKCYPYKK